MSLTAPITGTWRISLATGVDLLHLTLRRMLAGGRGSATSFKLPLAALPGLSLEALLSEGAQVHFELVRDAGVLAFEGHVSQGQGGGSFAFEVSLEFMEGMQSLGYESLTVESLFMMASYDVNRVFVRELSALGYERVPVAQLVEMRIHGVSTKFVQELQALGYEHPPVEQLIAMHIHGVGPDLIRQFRELGYERVPVAQLVEMRIHGISTKFVQELQALGYEHPPVEQLIAMRMSTV